MDKNRLREIVIKKLSEDMDVLVRAANMARDEATDEESQAEGKYDTRAIEAGYLAGSQARLAAELADNIGIYRVIPLADFSGGVPIAVGAVVSVETRGETTRYLLGPCNGGLEVSCEGTTVLVITPHSPLGNALLGKRQGDRVKLAGHTRAEPLKIVSVE